MWHSEGKLYHQLYSLNINVISFKNNNKNIVHSTSSLVHCFRKCHSSLSDLFLSSDKCRSSLISKVYCYNIFCEKPMNVLFAIMMAPNCFIL